MEQQLYFNFFMTFVYQVHQQKTLVFGECFLLMELAGYFEKYLKISENPYRMSFLKVYFVIKFMTKRNTEYMVLADDNSLSNERPEYTREIVWL